MTKDGFNEIVATMGACKGWLDSAKIPYDGGDIVAMAKLVIAREREIADETKRAQLEKTTRSEINKMADPDRDEDDPLDRRAP